jgi:hypothetical protein
MLDALTDLLCRFDEPEQFPILRINDSFVDQKIYVEMPGASSAQPPSECSTRAWLSRHGSSN